MANKIVLNKGRNIDIISQAEAVDSFKNLKKDFNKLSFSMYCAEIVSNYGVEEDINSQNIYDLLYGVLSSISKTQTDVELLLCVMRFQLKIMEMVGLQIALSVCSNCGHDFEEDKNYKGGILCTDCYEKLTDINGKIVSIHPKIVQFLSSLQKTDFNEKTIYDEQATQKVCITCFNLLKDYISYNSSRKFKTVDVIEFV